MLTEYAMRCAYLYEISKKEFELYHLTAPLNPVALRLVLRKHNESETVQEENDIMNRIAIGLSVSKILNMFVADAPHEESICHYTEENGKVISFVPQHMPISRHTLYSHLRRYNQFSIPGTSGLLYEKQEDGSALCRTTGAVMELDPDDRVYAYYPR